MATQVLILAAGRGSRLGPRTDDVPKPLLQIGPKHLVEHQLEMLADAGVGPVGMVLGYQRDAIQEVVGIRAEYLHNPRWMTTNSLYSLLMAREWVRGDLIVMNCDILLAPQILNRLLESGGDSFAFDSSSGDGREHMKVHLNEHGELCNMSKDLPPERCDGENVGLLYFKAETVQALFEEAAKRVAQGGENDWLGSAVQHVAQCRPLRGVDIAPLPWAEIDFAYDLDRARKQVWPAICKPRRPRPRALILALAVLALAGGLQTSFYVSSYTAEPQFDWDTLAATDGGQETRLVSSRGNGQKWWLVEPEQSVAVEVRGPDRIRVESRLVLAREGSESSPYLMDILIDDEVVDWMKCVAEPSRSVRWHGHRVSKRERELIDVPAGQHSLEVRLHSAEDRACLVRVRQAEKVTDDDA